MAKKRLSKEYKKWLAANANIPTPQPMSQRKHTRTDYARGMKEFNAELNALCKKYAWLKNRPERKKPSPYPRLTLAEQARRAPIISALCRALDGVMPRNGETVAHFRNRTGKSI